MKKRKLLVAILAGIMLFGTTSMAGNGSFNFSITSRGSEKGAGAWINKSIGEKYATATVNTFTGEGAYLYVKNSSKTVISKKASVTSKGYEKIPYTKSAPIGKNYQLYVKGFGSSSNRATSLIGMWTP